jgi:hypothetical protein
MMFARSISAALALLVIGAAPGLCACGTLTNEGGGDVDLPNAGAGPFRALGEGELGNARSAPNALFDDETLPRDGSVIDLDGDTATLDVAGYFAANLEGEAPGSAPTLIVRYGAIDARSFDRSAEVVLDPSAAWEGGTVGAPSAVRVGEEVWLYYAAAGGVGLAKSSDGLTFSREEAPVLAPDAGGWERGAVPRSPGVAIAWDGSFRIFYEVDPDGDGRTRIGEARSADGVAWTRVGDGPALAPSAPTAGASGATSKDLPFDGEAVGSPFPVVVTSRTGARILRLYYGARDSAGGRAIGLAARFGDDGALERAASPVFGAGSSAAPREPCALVYDRFSLLFVTQRSAVGEETLAVAAGVGPGNADLPPPNPL